MRRILSKWRWITLTALAALLIAGWVNFFTDYSAATPRAVFNPLARWGNKSDSPRIAVYQQVRSMSPDGRYLLVEIYSDKLDEPVPIRQFWDLDRGVLTTLPVRSEWPWGEFDQPVAFHGITYGAVDMISQDGRRRVSQWDGDELAVWDLHLSPLSRRVFIPSVLAAGVSLALFVFVDWLIRPILCAVHCRGARRRRQQLSADA